MGQTASAHRTSFRSHLLYQWLMMLIAIVGAGCCSFCVAAEDPLDRPDYVALCTFDRISKETGFQGDVSVLHFSPIENTVSPSTREIVFIEEDLASPIPNVGAKVVLFRAYYDRHVRFTAEAASLATSQWFLDAPPQYWARGKDFNVAAEMQHVRYYFEGLDNRDSTVRRVAEVCFYSTRTGPLVRRELKLDATRLRGHLKAGVLRDDTLARMAIALAAQGDLMDKPLFLDGFRRSTSGERKVSTCWDDWVIAVLYGLGEEGALEIRRSDLLSKDNAEGQKAIVAASSAIRSFPDSKARTEMIGLLAALLKTGAWPTYEQWAIDELRRWHAWDQAEAVKTALDRAMLDGSLPEAVGQDAIRFAVQSSEDAEAPESVRKQCLSFYEQLHSAFPKECDAAREHLKKEKKGDAASQ